MSKPKKKQNNFKLLVRIMRGSTKFFVISIIFTLLAAFSDTLLPQLISVTIDGVIKQAPVETNIWVDEIISLAGGYQTIRDNLLIMAIVIAIISLVTAISRYGNRVFNTRGSETLSKNTRDYLFNHIQHLPFSWHMKNQTGDIIQRCTSDVDTVNRFIAEQLTSLIRIIAVLALSLYYMYSMNLKLAIISSVFIPVMIGYCLIYHKLISVRFRQADEAEGRVSARVQENLTGVRVVRAFGKERYERDTFWKQNNEYAGLWLKLNRVFTFFWSSTDLMVNIQIFVILIIGTFYCINGEMSAGNLIAFISYNHMMSWPVRQLGRIIADLSRADVSLSRIKDITDIEEEKDSENATTPDLHGDIVFDNVTFGYEDNINILSGLSMTIKEGQTIGILGSTGSGKSTIISLLDKLYPIEDGKGRITINGNDIKDIKSEYLRKNIGIVQQEPFLFSRTIAENIAITQNGVDLEEVRKACRIASLDETVESFTDKYDTTIGERGVTLSGGQKQRVAIARTIIQKTPIIVFDDSLSAVDTETDSKIRNALYENLGNCTVILISHRITTLMKSDKIFVIDKGAVAEEGTHEELIHHGGLYQQIYDIQQSGAKAVLEDEED